MEISILGSYITKFGEIWEKGLLDLLQEAVSGAILNAKISEKKIDAVYVANMACGSFNKQRHLNSIVSSFFHHKPPAMRIEGACASGGLAIIAAEHALLSSSYENVLVVGVEKMTDSNSSDATSVLASASHISEEYGSTFPALYALLTKVHMDVFKTTRNQLSSVAVKNHIHAFDNPNAQFHKKITLDQVVNSSIIADPIRLLDCSPVSDGAAAVILSRNKHKKKVKIIGFGHGQDSIDLANRENHISLQATIRAAKKAYEMASISASKIQVAEVHDCFTIAEILAIEDLGFFEKGMGGRATLENKTTYKGSICINPSGGLKAGGHPVGATGVKQVAYLNNLLEQKKYELALAHNIGGSGGTAVVHILSI